MLARIIRHSTSLRGSSSRLQAPPQPYRSLSFPSSSPRHVSPAITAPRFESNSYFGKLSLPNSWAIPVAAVLVPPGIAWFHSTHRNEAGPLFPLMAALLKASTTLEIARTASRIVLTFVPVILIKNHKNRYSLKKAELHGIPTSDEKRNVILNGIRNRTKLFHALIAIPILIFWGTVFASLERTPLTGRWRMIVLSPEEEGEIAAQLAGPGWYQAVGEILKEDGMPVLIPPSDWRYQWVKDTMRRLEGTIPILMRERELCPEWLALDPHTQPLPPPADYPLRPRPRASEYLRWACSKMCDEKEVLPVPHSIPGPPYSLLVVEKPNASNAFSYGFGPDGGGGVVVYSGFLDEILARVPSPNVDSATAPEAAPSTWSKLFGAFFDSPSSTRQPLPSPEQTSELAILLAHELAHLILSHHLETLSSATVFIPGTLSIISDFLRVLIFPVTMLFGPFVNDAVAQLGKVGSGELTKMGEYCTSVSQEIEADIVSARLLAHAGFDARHAVTFWENRGISSTECGHAEQDIPNKPERLVRKIMGSSHPVNEVRVDRLKSELVRWEVERRAAVARQIGEPVESGINILTA